MIRILNRLPVPNLKHYSLLSFGLFLIVAIYSQKILHDLANDKYPNDTYNFEYIVTNGYFYTTYKMIVNEPWCIWVKQNR